MVARTDLFPLRLLREAMQRGDPHLVPARPIVM
jgi:hypothetical protein